MLFESSVLKLCKFFDTRFFGSLFTGYANNLILMFLFHGRNNRFPSLEKIIRCTEKSAVFLLETHYPRLRFWASLFSISDN